jgi:hypothetical protein
MAGGRTQRGEAPEKGWLYVNSLSIEFPEGYATVVSVRQIDALEIEVDLTLRVRSKDAEDWRQIRRLALSQDRHTLIDRRDRDRIVRMRLLHAGRRGRCLAETDLMISLPLPVWPRRTFAAG